MRKTVFELWHDVEAKSRFPGVSALKLVFDALAQAGELGVIIN